MPREYTDHSRGHRYQQSYNEDVDPEYDARNYKNLSRAEQSHQRREREREREYKTKAPVEYERADRSEYKKHKKSSKKSKRKHSKEREDKKKKRLVEYDDITSESETGDVALQQHQPSPQARSRVSPEGGHHDRGYHRRPSPGTAIQVYKQHLIERSHSNSPVTSRDRSPPSRHHSSNNKSDKYGDKYADKYDNVKKHSSSSGSSKHLSHSQRHHTAPSPDPPPKAYRTAPEPPRAYAEPPKAYRSRVSLSPSPVRKVRHKSRSPSPYSYSPQRQDR